MSCEDDHITVEEKTPQIIDVRQPVDFAKGHAENSINIPLDKMEERLEEIKSIEAPIVVVCGGGTRNKRAHELLTTLGVKSEAGGGWKDANEKYSGEDK